MAVTDGKLPHDLRVMIVGDSITHGGEADYSWRYRIWEWFHAQHSLAPASHKEPLFVGPFIGTQENGPVLPPQPPDIPGEPKPDDGGPRTNGGYALDCDSLFTGSKTPGKIDGSKGNCRHFSAWGRQAAQCKGMIREQVEKHQPNLLLVLLGFNDIGWFVSDANGAIDSLHEFVQEARRANPKCNFVLGNIVERSFMEGRQDLVENTRKFNTMLKGKCPQWSSKDSRIAYADVAKQYSAGPDPGTPDLATYDGLHPNARGDLEIAYAFSIALHHDFGLGSSPMSLPAPEDIPKRDLRPPRNIVAKGSPTGITVTWDHVYGGQYSVRNRVKGDDHEWGLGVAMGPRFDTTFTSAGTEWEYQIRTTHGNYSGEWSETVSAVANRDTAPAPTNIKIWPEEEGFRLSFTPPPAKADGSEWNVVRYEVMYFDRDWPGAFICAYGARGPTTARFDHMRESIGHRHQVWMATWTDPEGGGLHRSCRPVIVGVLDAPPPPQNVKAEQEGTHGVKISWSGNEKRDAGYLVHWRRKNGDSVVGQGIVEDDIVLETEKVVRFLDGAARQCEFWVVAVNGELDSPASQVVTL